MPTVHSVLRDNRFLAFDLNALRVPPARSQVDAEALQRAIRFASSDQTRLCAADTTFFSPAGRQRLEPGFSTIAVPADAVEARGSMI